MFPYQELQAVLESEIAEVGVTREQPLTSDLTISQIRCIMLSRSFLKKLAPKGVTVEADQRALEKFKGINSGLPDPAVRFEYPTETEQDDLFWSYFRDNVYKSLTSCDSLDLEFVRETMAAGPGASLGCNNANFFTKMFASKISATSEHLVARYRAAVCESDSWMEAERLRFEQYGLQIVSGNRLFFVPKDAEISRTCCTEPLVNMLIQKSIGAYLERVLKSCFGISLSMQPDFNRELARVGSIDGSFGTIDLVSASDSIGWSLVQRIMPPGLLGWISMARCERTVLPDGTEEDLRMVSTMGNGFTFPLQTLLFACAVRSVYQLMGYPSSCPRTQFGVFGDDIVVRREAYDFVIRSLVKLGFKVNDNKSFNTGAFRESCGHDWYSGHFVRGVYVKSLETVSDVYSCINRLNRWVAMTRVPLNKTLNFLLSSLGDRSLHLVPFSEQIDSGIQVPFVMTKPRVTNEYWFAYRKLASRATTYVVMEKGSEDGDVIDELNPLGLLVTVLGGFARRRDVCYKSDDIGLDGFVRPDVCRSSPMIITERSADDTRRMKVVSCKIPFWDWQGSKMSERMWLEDGLLAINLAHDLRHFSFSSWEEAVATGLNLLG